MVAVVYVARHGLRANSEPSPTGIDGDVRLSTEGEFQAEELARFLSSGDHGSAIDAIYCSPFYRCLQTVTPTSHALGDMPINVETGVGEYYHVSRPTHPVPLPASASKAKFPTVNLKYVPQVSVPSSGETLDSLFDRVRRAMDAVLAHADAHKFKTILIMTHAATKIKISEVLTGTTVRAGTCSLDKHEFVDGHFVTTQNGLTSFLSGGEQMHWSFDMAFEAGSAADEASRADPHAESVARSEPTASKMDATAGAEDPIVKVYLPLDSSALPPEAQPDAGVTTGSIEVDGLETERPLAKIGDKIYEGQWTRVLGTELYTTPEGESVGQSEYRLQLLPVEVQPENLPRKKLVDRLKDIDREKGRDVS